jgi:iron complex outermembrane receptor protein
VRQEDAEGRAFFQNAALSRHLGAEVGLGVTLPLFLHLRAAYTLLDAVYLAYAPEGEALTGRRLPGLPPHQAGGELTFRHPVGLLAGLQLFTVGGRFADDANRVEDPLRWLASARVGYRLQLGRWNLSPFLGAHNLLSSRYNDSVRINATGGRYFEPGPPFSLHAGVGVAWEPLSSPDAAP